MRAYTPFAFVATAGLVAVLGCELEDLDKPPPPETEAIVQSLEEPTGSVGDRNAEETAEYLRAVTASVRLFCGFGPVEYGQCLQESACDRCVVLEAAADAMRDVSEAIREGDEPDAGEGTIRGVSGFLDVQRICSGWGERRPDPANGLILGKIGFTGRGLDPVMWGTFEDCERRVEGLRVRLNGDFFFAYPVEAVPRNRFDQIPTVFHFDGTVYVEGPPSSTSDVVLTIRQRLDARGPLQVVLRPEDAGGTLVLRVDADGVTLRTVDGDYRCDFEESRCELL